MSDYATYPFDFHKLFTLQKLWQRLLSCAKAFTYVVCLENAAAVIAIILKKKKRQSEEKQTGIHGACLFLFSCVVSILFVLLGRKINQTDEAQKSGENFYKAKQWCKHNCLHSYAKVSIFTNVFMAHPGNNVVNAHNIVYTRALISEQ